MLTTVWVKVMEIRLMVLFLWINLALSTTLEFYWLKVSKFSVESLRDWLTQELQTYCNSTGNSLTKCGIASNGVLDDWNIVLGEPTQSGSNVAIDVNAQYSVSGTHFPLANSRITAMLSLTDVRERISNGMGSWLEMVDDERYYIQANNMYNITISISVAVVVFVLLIFTLILRKRASNLEKLKRNKPSKVENRNGKSPVERHGPESPDAVDQTVISSPHLDVDLTKIYNDPTQPHSKERNGKPHPIYPKELGSKISVTSSATSKRSNTNKNRIENSDT